MVGPKLFLKVVGAKLSLSRNFAHHGGFRVCARKPRGAFPVALGITPPFSPSPPPARPNAVVGNASHGKAPDGNEGCSGSGWGEPVTEGSAVTIAHVWSR